MTFSESSGISAVPISTHCDAMATDGWRLHHTMIRIKDPKASQKFYGEILGMTLLNAQRTNPLLYGLI